MTDRPMLSCASLADLRPGDIGFGPLKGVAHPAVWLGQAILGEGFHVGALNIGHVFAVTEAAATRRGIGMTSWPRIVEAMPGGARSISIDHTRWTRDYAYVRLPEDYPGQADDAAAIARAMIGTPYSFASYAALAAWRLGLKARRLEKWINRRRDSEVVFPSDEPGTFRAIRQPHEAICSVLVDQAWSLAGKQIMHGVAHQCVTPGALAGRLLQMSWDDEPAVWTFPGR